MCGIAGILYRDRTRGVDAAVLQGMAAALAHRGPDAEGFWQADGVGLAHRRLAIIDLESGDQPLGNEDGSVQIVFNGEIYNYQALRQRLLDRGHRFRTRSDTEVLVHLYEDEGDRLVEHLRGMFAFAIWDDRRRQLTLARDRVGQKPLYVYRDDEKLLFASELKGILAHPGVDRSIDVRAISDYLTFGVIPGGRCIFRRMEKVPPAHVLSFAADGVPPQRRQYWSVSLAADLGRSVGQWREAVEAKLAETVSAHRVADVPVGAFLSGGLDSSVLVSQLASLDEKPVRTFSIGFREAAFSELPQARLVARRFGTQHVEEVVTAEAAGSLDDLVHFYDEPFADSSAIPTMHVARLARTHGIKVVISGDGGDEAFGGYARYPHDLREARLRRCLPAWLRGGPIAWLAAHWPKADWLPRVLRAKTRLTNLSLSPAEAYANTVSLCRPGARRQLLSADLLRELEGHCSEEAVTGPFNRAPAGDPLAGMLAADIGFLLPDDFLTKVDRASMSCGVEVRPPLVDHEFLELAAAMPSDLKVRGGETKWLFKQLARDRLPPEILQHRKQGFEIPLDDWLRAPLREVFESTVLTPGAPVADWIAQPAVRALYQSHLARTGRHGSVLWSVLVLAKWAETYLSSSSRPPAALVGALA